MNKWASKNTRAPKTWYFEGSDDEQNWTELDYQTNQTNWGDSDARFYNITNNNTPFKMYRLRILENNGAAALISIAEIKLYGYRLESKISFPPLSTLKTTITSATLDATDGLTLTGDVTADENNETSYYAFATTKQIATNAEARTLINNLVTSNSEAVINFVPFTTFEELFGTGFGHKSSICLQTPQHGFPETTTYKDTTVMSF